MFPHQDSPWADGQGKHCCRSGPSASEVSKATTPEAGVKGRAEVAADSLKPWPATPTAPVNWVWTPGEKTSVLIGVFHQESAPA